MAASNNLGPGNGTREEIHPRDDGPHQASAGRLLGYCQEGGQEQLQEPRAGEDRPPCQVAGPGHIMEVTYLYMLPPPSLIFTPPMCGPHLIITSRLAWRRNIWPPTPTAPNLPTIVPAPVGGEFAEDGDPVSRAQARGNQYPPAWNHLRTFSWDGRAMLGAQCCLIPPPGDSTSQPKYLFPF